MSKHVEPAPASVQPVPQSAEALAEEAMLEHMTDREVTAYLDRIYGNGPWTLGS